MKRAESGGGWGGWDAQSVLELDVEVTIYKSPFWYGFILGIGWGVAALVGAWEALQWLAT